MYTFLQAMLQNYSTNPTQNWRSKDAAIYLVTSSASKGQTQKHGVTQTSDLVPLPQFCTQQIILELEKPNGEFYFFAIFVITVV